MNDNETYTCTFCDNQIEADELCEHENHTWCRDCCNDNKDVNPVLDWNDLDWIVLIVRVAISQKLKMCKA